MNSYRFYNMGKRGLEYPVICKDTIVIPAGTTGVKIAFGQSHLSYKDQFGKFKKMNVYLYKGKIYHA